MRTRSRHPDLLRICEKPKSLNDKPLPSENGWVSNAPKLLVFMRPMTVREKFRIFPFVFWFVFLVLPTVISLLKFFSDNRPETITGVNSTQRTSKPLQ